MPSNRDSWAWHSLRTFASIVDGHIGLNVYAVAFNRQDCRHTWSIDRRQSSVGQTLSDRESWAWHSLRTFASIADGHIGLSVFAVAFIQQDCRLAIFGEAPKRHYGTQPTQSFCFRFILGPTTCASTFDSEFKCFREL